MSSPLCFIWLILSKCLKADMAHFVFKKCKTRNKQTNTTLSYYCFQLTDCLVSESWMFQQMLAVGRLAHSLEHNSKRKKTKFLLGKDFRKFCCINKCICYSNHIQVVWVFFSMSNVYLCFIKYLFTDRVWIPQHLLISKCKWRNEWSATNKSEIQSRHSVTQKQKPFSSSVPKGLNRWWAEDG